MKIWRKILCAALMLCIVGTLPALSEADDRMEDFMVTLADGTQVSLYGLLETKQAVLINLWATWCEPCREEFPDLLEAYLKVEDQVGLLALSVEAEDTDDVIRQFQQENGLEKLPMGRDPVGLSERFGFEDVPAFILVDRSGKIRDLESGSIASVEEFDALFASVLNGSESEYILHFVDQHGNPVSGVMVQVCDDSTCQLYPTNVTGTVSFTRVPYPYEIHVLMVPDGYTFDVSETFILPEEGGELTVELTKD